MISEKKEVKKLFTVLMGVEGTLEIPILAVDDEEAISTVEIMNLEDMLKTRTDYNLDVDPLEVWEEKEKEE
jgi:hypothetical protein